MIASSLDIAVSSITQYAVQLIKLDNPIIVRQLKLNQHRISSRNTVYRMMTLEEAGPYQQDPLDDYEIKTQNIIN